MVLGELELMYKTEDTDIDITLFTQLTQNGS